MTAIAVDEFILEKSIGKGAFGEVFYTKKKGSSMVYATKRMKREIVEEKKNVKYFMNEVQILKEIYHKNIVKVETLRKTNNHYYIIMEYCNGGTLRENLDKYKLKYRKNFSEKIIQHIMRQLIDAVAYLHSKGILHRDLKTQNILLNYITEEAKTNLDILNSELKIIDFNTATKEPNNTLIGSPYNMDPHILKALVTGQKMEFPYTEKIDIWSLGIIAYYLFTGYPPFIGNHCDIMNQIEKGDISIPLDISAEAISFLIKMLKYSSQKRYSAADLSNHPFIKRYINDFSYLEQKNFSNFIRKGNLIVNVKESDNIDSIINQYINKTEPSISSNSTNNNLDTNYSSIQNPSFFNSAPLLKKENNNLLSQISNNFSSDILNQPKNEQIKNYANEVNNKENNYNNSQNASNSSPVLIMADEMETIITDQPVQNSMIEIPHNPFDSQFSVDNLNYRNQTQINPNMKYQSAKTNNNYYLSPGNNNFNNQTNINQNDRKNNNNELTSAKNKSESSKIINSFQPEEFTQGQYNSIQPTMMNNMNTYQIYDNGIKNIIIDNSLNNQIFSTNNFYSSLPVQGIKHLNK